VEAAADTDAAGRFVLWAPDSGMWKVVIRQPGAVPLEFTPIALVSPIELPPAVIGASGTSAGAAGTWTAVSVPAKPAQPPAAAVAPLTVSGRVIDAGKIRLDQQPFWTLAPGGTVVQQWPLVGGKALIDGVPAGAWVVQVEASDGPKWKGAAVTAGVDAAVTVE
jgi:hypothetical protein